MASSNVKPNNSDSDDDNGIVIETPPLSPRTAAVSFQKMRSIGFNAYVAMCFMVTIFCMCMIVVDKFHKTQGPDYSNFYTLTIGFILGKFTILVVDKLISRRSKIAATNGST